MEEYECAEEVAEDVLIFVADTGPHMRTLIVMMGDVVVVVGDVIEEIERVFERGHG